MADASLRLKKFYGPSFIIAAAPYGGRNSGTRTPANSGGEVTAITNRYQDMALTLGSNFDLMMQQFYMNGFNTVAGVKDWSKEYITRCKLRDDQWAFGYSVRDPSDPDLGAVTPEFCNDVWNSWRADGREARGSMIWTPNRDRTDPAGSYRWAKIHGSVVRSTV